MESTHPLRLVAVCTLTIYVTPQQSVMKLASEVAATGKSTIAMDGFRCQFSSMKQKMVFFAIILWGLVGTTAEHFCAFGVLLLPEK